MKRRQRELFSAAVKSRNWPLVESVVKQCDFDILILSDNIGSIQYSALNYDPKLPLEKQMHDNFNEIIIGKVDGTKVSHLRIYNFTRNTVSTINHDYILYRITERLVKNSS